MSQKAVFTDFRKHGPVAIEKYLAHGGDPFIIDESRRMSLLHAAGMCGDLRLCKVLVGKGLKKDAKDKLGNDPYFYSLFGQIGREKNKSGLSENEREKYEETQKFLCQQPEIFYEGV